MIRGDIVHKELQINQKFTKIPTKANFSKTQYIVGVKKPAFGTITAK